MGYFRTPMSYEEINSRRRKEGVLLNLCAECEEATVVPPSERSALCKRCFQIWASQPQSDNRALHTETAMRRKSAYEDLVWTGDEEPGAVKTQQRSTKTAEIEAERERRFCTSCNREKQSTAFDERKKTCGACLENQRLRRASNANILEATGRILGPNPPQGTRSGLRRELPVEIPGPSEPVKESELDRKGKEACEKRRKMHSTGAHRGSAEALNPLGETSEKRVIATLLPENLGGKGLMEADSLQHINNAKSKRRALPTIPPRPGTKQNRGTTAITERRALPPLLLQPSTKEKNETTALDKELRDIAHTATMRALKIKLDKAEKAQKEAKSTLAVAQYTQKACLERMKELNRQEAQAHTVAVEAEKLLDELKLRIVKQEVTYKLPY